MAHTWPEIFTAMQLRRSADSARFQRMIDVRDRANGDIVIPLPDVDGEPTLEPPTPRLIMDAIDATAMQAGSQTPTIFSPPLDPAKVDGIRSMEYAAVRRRALYASWYQNALDVLMLRYFRHLVGYGTGCMLVLPDFERECARIELRDPLSVYPEMRSPDDVREPLNVGIVFGRSRSWLRKHYGDKMGDWLNLISEDLWDVVEWTDEDEIVVGVLGPRFGPNTFQMNQWGNPGNRPYSQGIELRRWPNRAGMVPVAIPRRVTLDKIMGQVDTIIGSVDLLTRLAALEVVAAEKAVFPDLQVIGPKGNMPTLVGGEWKDGRTGEANVIIDGEARYLVSSVGPATFQTMANMERNIRLSSGNPGMFGGELTGSLRSGQTVNSLAGISVNPRTQEAHLIAQRALSVINSAVLATEKGYWPDKKYVVFSGVGGEGMVEYTPSKHFETTDNAVFYPFPGLDVSQITVALAQLNAAGGISRTTLRQQHPLIKDADFEERKVLVERLDEARLSGILAGMQQGQFPPEYYVELRKQLVKTGELGPAEEAAMAILKQQQEQQAQEQAAQAPPGGPPAGPSGDQGAPAWAPQPGPANTPGVNQDQMRVYQAQRILREMRSQPPANVA